MAIQRIGKVTVLAALGAGANSSIVKVRRDEDGKEYALKVVPIAGEDDRKFLAQAEHEFRVGQLLDHPAVMKVFCFETESDWLFRVRKAKLLTEFVPGRTLDCVPMTDPARLLRVLEKVAAGLVHLHRRGVIHADLKPNNLMLDRGTAVKIIDFGLAWVKGEEKNRVQGTPGYIAPETAAKKVVDERTDVFNFGATMYRLVTGRLPPSAVPDPGGLPLTGAGFAGLLAPVRDLAPGTDPGFAELIHACLAYKPGDRPQRMSEVQGRLDRLADAAAAEHGDPDGD